jgi:hypothetical protein
VTRFCRRRAETSWFTHPRHLRYHATGSLLDGDNENLDIGLHKAFITAENINELAEVLEVPEDLDILSVDIDRNDYYVLKAILDRKKIRPKIVVVEYNSHFTDSRAVPYAAGEKWDGKSSYFGASLRALAGLLGPEGYELVHCEKHGVNAFFVLEELVEGGGGKWGLDEVWKPPNFFNKGWNYSEPVPPREWVLLPS